MRFGKALVEVWAAKGEGRAEGSSESGKLKNGRGRGRQPAAD